jgi:hypothetical protein
MLIRNSVFAGALIWTTVVFTESAVRSAHTDIVNAQGQKIGTMTIREAGPEFALICGFNFPRDGLNWKLDGN